MCQEIIHLSSRYKS
uniref:Uncharacterized protein n=1 Tax=Rhizophora mucronata TaxID=61149 RepID=A0A2P2IUI8_RHIMU